MERMFDKYQVDNKGQLYAIDTMGRVYHPIDILKGQLEIVTARGLREKEHRMELGMRASLDFQQELRDFGTSLRRVTRRRRMV